MKTVTKLKRKVEWAEERNFLSFSFLTRSVFPGGRPFARF